MTTRETRMAEFIGPLSLATDAANGMGPETAMRTSILAVALARAHGLTGEVVRDVYWTSVLRFLGCTSYAHETARDGAGDDLALLRSLLTVDAASPASVMAGAWRATSSKPTRTRASVLLGVVSNPHAHRDFVNAHCSAASALASDLGMSAGTQHALTQIHERWDGKGAPLGLRGDAIELAARVVQVAHRAEIHRALAGPQEALEEVERRAGGELDPALARTFREVAGSLFPALKAGVFTLFLEAEPAPRWWLAEASIRPIALAFARYADLKSTFTLGHSTGVAALSLHMAKALGLAAEEGAHVERAALLHDLGRTAIPNAIWDAPRPLDALERARAESHAHHTGSILALSPAFTAIAATARSAHERMDGSGYPSRDAGAHLTNLLAVADVVHALGESRPHRAPLDMDAIAKLTRSLVREGKLEAQSVDAALSALGAPKMPRSWPDSLSEREVEVLGLLARGESNKDIAQALSLSPKTVQHHVAHIYDKTGIRTRTGAALYAVRHALIDAAPRSRA
jgi:HD-GYP domain-containing protein (c-di-GMP phosphodiesterase class II)